MPTKSKSRTTTSNKKGLVERRLPTNRPPTHAGEMLLEEFLKPLEITQSAFAVMLGAGTRCVPRTRLKSRGSSH
jgi:antitoxin HigA-1